MAPNFSAAFDLLHGRRNAGQVPMTITATQLRIARGLLGWSRAKLAVASDVGMQIIKGFEDDTRRPSRDAIGRWRRVLERAGVTFVLGSKSGVNLNAAPADAQDP